ncbi:MAG: toprim domain-containing protein, partial [Oscillospiraceae bacterium]
LGTALTEKQALILAKNTKEILICYDSDEAGKKAAKRAVDILKKTNLNVKVIDILNAKDPDEFISKFGKTRFLNLINKSEDGILYQFNINKKGYNFENAHDNIEYIRRCLNIILNLSSPLEIDHYILSLSRTTGVGREIILDEFKIIKGRYRKKETYKKKSIFYNSINESNKDKFNIDKNRYLAAGVAEEHIILAILKKPELVDFVKKNLRLEDVVTSFNQKILKVIYDCDIMDINITYLTQFFDKEIISRVSKIVAENSSIMYNEDDTFKLIKKVQSENLNKKMSNSTDVSEKDLLDFTNNIKKQKS